MITISEIIKNIVKNKPLIEEELTLNLINLSALARLIKPQIESKLLKPVTINAIVMALKRYSDKLPKPIAKQSDVIKKINDISIRSNLTEYTFLNSHSILRNQKILLDRIIDLRDRFFTFTHGLFEVTLIVNSCIEKNIEKIFKKEKLISKLNNLSALIIHLPKETVHTPGIFYLLLKQLAWENINIIEEVSTYTEFIIILDKNNIDRAFSILKNYLWSDKRTVGSSNIIV